MISKNPYRDDVMTWGNLSPWKKLGIRLSHKVAFHPSDVKRDGQGNVLFMPLLPQKQCFARPEAIFRHGKRVQLRKLPNGKVVDSTNHQCGSCPPGVRHACIETAWERVQSDPVIRKAFNDWNEHCKTFYSGSYVYTGSASRLWGAFKEAIAARGPFQNTNDDELKALAARKIEKERSVWLAQKRRQREEERARTRSVRQLPSRQFAMNVEDERDRRLDSLMKVSGRPDQRLSISRVPSAKREATARITANAWAVREWLREADRAARPGTIARIMVDHGLSAGTSYATLKARMGNDLRRVEDCERDGLWEAFDRDRDLNTYETFDDESADALGDAELDVDALLRALDP